MSAPSEPGPPQPRCPRCGAPHELDQEYCLECGLRLAAVMTVAGPRGSAMRAELWTRDSPAWLWAALLASLLVALVAGAIVAVAATRDDEEQPGPDARAAAGSVVGTTETVPVLTGVGTITVEPPDTGAVPTAPAGVIGEWPAGTTGFTIVLASVEASRGRAAADEVAQRAAGAGLPQTGVLDSSAYSSLRPGYWVAFSGVYSTLAEAQAALAQARAAGFPLAYVREIRP